MIIWIFVAVAIIVLIYLFSSSSFRAGPGQVSTTTVEAPTTGIILNNLGSTTATTTKPQSRVIEISAKPFSFIPKAIMVNDGDMVELRITTASGFAHNFSIDEFGINEPLSDGQTTVIRFTPQQKGTFTFYCDVGNHRGQGMVGTLTVK